MRMLSLARAHVVVGTYAVEEISRISRMFSQTGREDFWGVELSTKQKSTTWPEDDDEDESEDDIEQTLFLHHACLGQGAKDNDINIVSLTTYDGDDKKVTLPIAWLTTKTPQVSMRLPLRPPVKLELTQGSGPVAICGIHEMVLTGPDDFSDEGDDDDDQKLEVESPEIKAIKGKEKEGIKVSQKRKAESQVVESAKKTAKKRKQTEVIEEESDDDDDDDDDEEMDDEDLRNYLNKVKGSFNGMADDENDEDEDDDDDDDGDEDEDDEDDEEDEEDDDEDEESEEEEPKKMVSKGQKGKLTQVKQKTQTPKQEQKPKTPQTTGKKTKTVTPAKTTPASGGKSGLVAKTISEVKAKLLQSPNLPKKVDKFSNYLKHTFKIDDPGTQKQLWEFVQKKK